MCLVIAEVIATFSMVFQNEANLNLPYLEKYFLLHMGDGEEPEEPEDGDSNDRATPNPN